MTRSCKSLPGTLAYILGLSALLAAPTRLRAQDVVVAPADAAVPPARAHNRHVHGLFRARPEPIPRTYSYLYDTWFNQPRHTRVVDQNGRIRWKTTVRGLPMGTPWTHR